MLDLYQYTATNGGRGHVSGHDEDEARERLTRRGLGPIEKIEPLITIEDLWAREAERQALGVHLESWPPTAQETVYYDQLMISPSPF